MFRTFPELGIEFAKEGAAVVLHTTSATVDTGVGASREPGGRGRELTSRHVGAVGAGVIYLWERIAAVHRQR